MFGQSHKFIDDEFQNYTRGLGYYQDHDLDFPGVNVISVKLQSVTPEDPNSLTTYMDHKASIQLNSLDLTKSAGSSVLIKYSRLNTVPFTYTITVTSSLPSTSGMIRIFLIPGDVYLTPEVDISQLAIEMDRFHVSLTKGVNTITRQSTESSFVAKHRDSLYDLQNKLMWGALTQDQFNWAGCGWPKVRLLMGIDYLKLWQLETLIA